MTFDDVIGTAILHALRLLRSSVRARFLRHSEFLCESVHFVQSLEEIP